MEVEANAEEVAAVAKAIVEGVDLVHFIVGDLENSSFRNLGLLLLLLFFYVFKFIFYFC